MTQPDPKTVTHRVPRCQLVTNHLHHCMDTWMNGIPVLAGMDLCELAIQWEFQDPK